MSVSLADESEEEEMEHQILPAGCIKAHRVLSKSRNTSEYSLQYNMLFRYPDRKGISLVSTIITYRR